MIRRVKDYTKFDEFETKLSKSLRPKIENIVKMELDKNRSLIDNIQRLKTYFLATLGLSALFLIISIIVFFATTGAALIFILPAAMLVITFVLWSSRSKSKGRLYVSIKNGLDYNVIYKIALEGVPNVSLKEVSDRKVFNNREIEELTSPVIPERARIFDKNPTISALLFDKYDVEMTSYGFEWIVNSGKQRTRQEGWNFYLKINTKPLQEQNFNFTFFTTKNYLRQYEKADLENKHFNKTFIPRTNDQIKMRMLLTPLAMETMLNRFNDARENNVSSRHFDLISKDNFIYYTLFTDKNFLRINFDLLKINEEAITKSIYSDIVYDIYDLYYMLSFVIIPSYLG